MEWIGMEWQDDRRRRLFSTLYPRFAVQNMAAGRYGYGLIPARARMPVMMRRRRLANPVDTCALGCRAVMRVVPVMPVLMPARPDDGDDAPAAPRQSG